MQGRHVSISGVLKYLGVSRSGYTSFLHRQPSHTEKRRNRVKEEIQTIYEHSFRNYGAPKIAYELRKGGEIISQRTVGKYMSQMGIHAQWVKHWIRPKQDSDFTGSLTNILSQNFNPCQPNTFWCTDITYIWTYEDGFVYLTTIMDLFSRKIIAWTLSKTMETPSCVTNTVKKAMNCRNTINPLVIHSDRGPQYKSKDYCDITKKMNMKRSYSKKGYPYDNACIESFHALIKREWLNRFRIADYDEACYLVWEYIETYYNTVRIHGHCDYMSPNQYEKLYDVNSKKLIKENGKRLTLICTKT